MKKIILMAVVAISLLTACKTPETEVSGKKYVLTSYNQNQISITNAPFIMFSTEGIVTGKVCNSFTGKYTIENNVLKAMAASTKKMCVDDVLNSAETALFQGFFAGADINANGSTLVIKHNNNTFTFEQL